MLGTWDRILTPEGDAHRFTEACFALSSGTRLGVLTVLMTAREPMHIREIARRVGLDPSPVRTHLELLVKTGFAREVPEPGRERRFIADIAAVRLVSLPPDRPTDVPLDVAATKQVHKLTDKIHALDEKVHRLQREIAALADERAGLWRDLADEASRSAKRP